MTTHTDIPDSDIDPESPGTTTLFFRLRDNPKAVWEGDASAPKIAYNALGPPAITAGTTYSLTEAAGGSTSAFSYAKIIEWQVSLSGTVNVYFGLSTGSAGDPAYAKIYVNGSPVGTERSTTSTTAVYFSENISISDGDLVQIYAHATFIVGFYDAIVDGALLRCAATIPGSIVRTV